VAQLLLLLPDLLAPAVHWWRPWCPCEWRRCGWCQQGHPCTQDRTGQASTQAEQHCAELDRCRCLHAVHTRRSPGWRVAVLASKPALLGSFSCVLCRE
jgi:hypothetical protein